MNTTYDEIYKCFKDNTKTEDYNLPTTDEGKYNMINNAVMHYNNKMQTYITCDDNLEEISEELDSGALLILSLYIKYIYKENELSHFEDIYSLFQKDMGFKNYKNMQDGKTNAVIRVENQIDKIIANQTEDFI